MELLLSYVEANAPAVLFNVALLIISYLVARILRARQATALGFGFLPILIAIGLQGI